MQNAECREPCVGQSFPTALHQHALSGGNMRFRGKATSEFGRIVGIAAPGKIWDSLCRGFGGQKPGNVRSFR